MACSGSDPLGSLVLGLLHSEIKSSTALKFYVDPVEEILIPFLDPSFLLESVPTGRSFLILNVVFKWAFEFNENFILHRSSPWVPSRYFGDFI